MNIAIALLFSTIIVLVYAFDFGISLVIGGAYSLFFLGVVSVFTKRLPSLGLFLFSLILGLSIVAIGIPDEFHRWMLNFVYDQFHIERFDPQFFETNLVIIAISLFVIAAFMAKDKGEKRSLFMYAAAITLGFSAIVIDHIAVIESGLMNQIKDIKSQADVVIRAKSSDFYYECKALNYECHESEINGSIETGQPYLDAQVASVRTETIRNMLKANKVGQATSSFVGADFGNQGILCVYAYATDGIHQRLVIDQERTSRAFASSNHGFGLAAGSAWLVWVWFGFLLVAYHRNKLFKRGTPS